MNASLLVKSQFRSTVLSNYVVWYEPTCLKKAVKAITVGCHSQLLYASPSLSELRSMVAALTASEVPDKTTAGWL